MNSYQFSPLDPRSGKSGSIQRQSDKMCIPFDMTNTDCQQFLLDWANGAVVTNPDGSLAPYSSAAVAALDLTPPS